MSHMFLYALYGLFYVSSFFLTSGIRRSTLFYNHIRNISSYKFLLLCLICSYMPYMVYFMFHRFF